MEGGFFKAAWNDRMRLDPRTKLLLMILINIAMLTGTLGGAAIWIRPVFAVIPVVLIMASRKYGQAVFWGMLYAICWYCENFLLHVNTAGIGIVVGISIGVISKISSGVAMAVYFINTTTIGQFICAMEKLHMPKFITIPLAVVFRFLPAISEESASIRDSMYMRGLSAKNPIAYLEYRMVPLLVSMTRIGDELSAAALTKGMGSPIKRVPVVSLSFHVIDGVFCVTVLLACAVYMIL